MKTKPSALLPFFLLIAFFGCVSSGLTASPAVVKSPKKEAVELYFRKSCPYCRKVLSFLTLENLAVKMLDMEQQPQLRDKLKQLSGKTQVPCLVIDGKPLFESDDIIAWLKQNKPKKARPLIGALD